MADATSTPPQQPQTFHEKIEVIKQEFEFRQRKDPYRHMDMRASSKSRKSRYNAFPSDAWRSIPLGSRYERALNQVMEQFREGRLFDFKKEPLARELAQRHGRPCREVYFKAVRPSGTDFWSGLVEWAPSTPSESAYPRLVKHPGRSPQSELFDALGALSSSPMGLTQTAADYLSVATVPTGCYGMEWPARLLAVTAVDGHDVEMPGRGILPLKRSSTAWEVLAELPAHMLLGPQGRYIIDLLDEAGRVYGKREDSGWVKGPFRFDKQASLDAAARINFADRVSMVTKRSTSFGAIRSHIHRTAHRAGWWDWALDDVAAAAGMLLVGDVVGPYFVEEAMEPLYRDGLFERDRRDAQMLKRLAEQAFPLPLPKKP